MASLLSQRLQGLEPTLRLFGSCLADNPPIAQLDGSVAVGSREGAVSNKYHRQIALHVERTQQIENRLPRLGIQISGWLIGEKNARLRNESTRHCDALLFPPAKLGRPPGTRGQWHLQLIQHCVNTLDGFQPPNTEKFEWPSNILLYCEGLEQVESLKNKSDLLQP